MEFEAIEEDLIDYFKDVLIGGTHGLQIDSIVEEYFCFCDFLIAFRKDIVRIILESFIHNLHCFFFSNEHWLRLLE